ncbi:hypothetical protein [Paenibacillus taichungensis]|uniref:hypothetical protein n=1 Tax=Paenibacillus taichungensis TaxID=484184 RepID=UPI0038D1E4BF
MNTYTDSPKLVINKLILKGHEKDYVVTFSLGINIIYGDSDSGKSSILNLIDYLLGAKKIYMYEEIEKHGRYALLEVELNGKTYTIKRDIFKPEDLIEVFSTGIENISDLFPALYSPNYKKEGPAGYFSDFLLNALNIPLVKIKQSPTKADSDLTRLSFRDIFKYCYLDQDDVGSRNILDSNSPVVFTKNKEVFKFIYNLLDSQITDLQGQISEKTSEKNKLIEKHDVIASFFRDTQIDSLDLLNEELTMVRDELELIEMELASITQRMRSDSSYFDDLRKLIVHLESENTKYKTNKSLKLGQMEQHIRLKKDYKQDIEKLTSSLAVIKKLPDKHEEVDCPVCNSRIGYAKLALNFESNPVETVKAEVNSLKNRLKEIDTLIEEERNNIIHLESEEQRLLENLEKAREMLDINTENFVAPFITQRDEFVAEKARVLERINKIEQLIKMRKQLNELISNSEILQNQIAILLEKLDALKASAPSIDDVLINLADYLRDFLINIPIKNPHGISINSKSFLPVVRERNYAELTSGGLRTLVSVGYYFSLLQHSLSNATNYPSFIMIDTIGKYLGKTKRDNDLEVSYADDALEGLDDPTKYINLYKHIAKISESMLKKQKSHQIIIVDNDLPADAKGELMIQQYVVKHFNSSGTDGASIGFIDNA